MKMAANVGSFAVMAVVTAAGMMLGAADVDSSPVLPEDYPSIQERCRQHPADVFAHPGQCQLYYNCSVSQVPSARSSFHQFLQECPYPALFSQASLTCQPFQQVSCGARVEYVDYCDYLVSRCGSAHCVPCWVLSPSCQGLPDGDNPHPLRPRSPYFLTCRSGRLMAVSSCPVDATSNVREIFSPETGHCVSQ